RPAARSVDHEIAIVLDDGIGTRISLGVRGECRRSAFEHGQIAVGLHLAAGDSAAVRVTGPLGRYRNDGNDSGVVYNKIAILLHPDREIAASRYQAAADGQRLAGIQYGLGPPVSARPCVDHDLIPGITSTAVGRITARVAFG